MAKAVEVTCKKRGIEIPALLMEPGRSLVGSAGITLYTVGGIKDIPNVRKYISVDGGMGDNPRYILYEAEYTALRADDANASPCEKVTVAGKCCESGDLLMKDVLLPHFETGDIMAVLATGAYNYSMASNYNRIPRPPVIMVTDGKPHEIVRRESYEDIIKNDVL